MFSARIFVVYLRLEDFDALDYLLADRSDDATRANCKKSVSGTGSSFKGREGKTGLTWNQNHELSPCVRVESHHGVITTPKTTATRPLTRENSLPPTHNNVLVSSPPPVSDRSSSYNDLSTARNNRNTHYFTSQCHLHITDHGHFHSHRVNGLKTQDCFSVRKPFRYIDDRRKRNRREQGNLTWT